MSASSSRASASTPIGSDRDSDGGARGAGGGSGSARSVHRSAEGGGGGRRELRRRLLVIAGSIAVLGAVDLMRAPERQWSGRALLAAIDAYQATLSPLLRVSGARCRFVPSCSHYAADAIREDGALWGSVRALARVARCGPWTPMGTVDPA